MQITRICCLFSTRTFLCIIVENDLGRSSMIQRRPEPIVEVALALEWCVLKGLGYRSLSEFRQ